MDFFSGSGSRNFISFRLGKEMDGQPQQNVAEEMEVDPPSIEQAPGPEVREVPADKRSVIELSSNTDSESCDAYIKRTVELLDSAERDPAGPADEIPASPADEIPAEVKLSVSELVAVTPALNEMIPEVQLSESIPRVVFLDKTDSSVEPNNAVTVEQSPLTFHEIDEQAPSTSRPDFGADGTSAERQVHFENVGFTEQTPAQVQFGSSELVAPGEGRGAEGSGSGEPQVNRGPMD